MGRCKDGSRLNLKVTLIAKHRRSKHKFRMIKDTIIEKYGGVSMCMYSARSQGHSPKENAIKEGTQFEIWNIEQTYAL